MKTTLLPCFGPALRSLALAPILMLTLSGALGQTVYEPGKSYFGRSNYVEYIAGDMPLIISAPHGGTLQPAALPDRKDGEFTSDANTEELIRTVQQVFHQYLGHYPHIIICRLDRCKVDCNREIEEGEREQAARMSKAPAAVFTAAAPKAAKRTEREVRKELSTVEKTVARLDQEKKQALAQMLESTDAAETLRLHNESESLAKQLAAAEDRWCQLQEELGDL